jgi:L-arabinonolactonase
MDPPVASHSPRACLGGTTLHYTIECVVENSDELGEGPIWDVEGGLLYWVDGTGRRVGKPSIWRLDPRNGRTSHWALDHDVGALALRRDGGAVLANDDGFYFFDFDRGALELIAYVDPEHPRTRLNDGKCDRAGRFFAGGMDDKEELGICGLWRLDPDLRITRVDDGIICSNGPCWSPDDKTFYFADTFQQVMWAYDYDLTRGTVSNRREFASTRDDPGFFDGSTVDAEGCVWNALVIGGELIRYTPDGEVERRIGMPVKNITSLTFGGPDLDEIYVTSMARVRHPAVHDHFAKQVRPQFGAGSLFRIRGLGIRGLPEPRFAG